MMTRHKTSWFAVALMSLAFTAVRWNAAVAAGLEPALQAKLDAKVAEIKGWASDPAIVKTVKTYRDAPSAEAKAMTQDKWKALSVIDPFVRTFTKNEAGQFLKSKKTDVIAEAFICGADGTKVAFLSKPTNWSHAGKPKHEKPMANETWQGGIEVDESTGIQQVQVAVPVLEDGKPIASLVVGINMAKL